MAHDMVRWPPGPSFSQPIDPFVELGVALNADGVIPALVVQQIKERRNGKGGIGPEPPPDDRRASLGCVPRQHRLQNILPAICAVHIAGTQAAPTQITELVEYEQRVQALRLEVAIPGRSLLVAENRAFGTVHVQSDDPRRSPVMHGINPTTGKVRQYIEVLTRRQHPRLEPAHGAGRGRAVLHRPPADQLAHHRIAAKPIGVIYVFISSRARENGFAQEPSETMPSVLSCTRITDQSHRHVHQAKGIIQFPMKQQTDVRADRRPTKCQLDQAVKLKPQRAGFRFTRRVPPPNPSSISVKLLMNMGYHASGDQKIRVHMGNSGEKKAGMPRKRFSVEQIINNVRVAKVRIALSRVDHEIFR
jgi:hypothetical protein